MTSLWRSIGGPNAITWPAFWMALVVSALMNLPDQYTVNTAATLPRNLLATVVAVLAMFAVMLAMKAAFLRGVDTRPRPWSTVAVFAVGAATRGLVLGLMLAAFGTGEAHLAFRVPASVLTLTLTLAITAAVVDLARTTAARRADLRAEAGRLQAEESEARARAEAVQQRAAQAVRDLLLGRLATMQASPDAELGPRLREDAEDVIRPLSHQMADAAQDRPIAPARDIGRITWTDVWRAASLGRPFRPVLVALLTLVASGPALVAYNQSLPRGLAYVAVAGLLVLLGLGLVDRLLTPRLPRMRPWVRGSAVIIGAIAGIGAAAVALALVIDATGGQSPFRLPLQMLALGPPVVVAIAIGQGLRQQLMSADAQLVAENARLRYGRAMAQAAAWHEERAVSRALHGPVQSAVVSAAMRIESGDRDGAARLLAEALSHLDDDTHALPVSAALDEVAEAWAGLCEVHVDMQQDVAARVDRDAPLASAVIDICTEACSNAVRHGRATRVDIEVRADRDTIALAIADDGAFTGDSPDPGLGTAMLDDVALSWQREQEGGLTVLRARLPAPDRGQAGAYL